MMFRRWGRRWGILLGALLVLPLVFWSVSWILHGWVPQGDEGWIALKVHDVFTSHPPVQGMRSTSNESWPGIWAHHPGPMQFYLLAIPYAAAGYHPAGLVIGGLLVVTGLIALALWHGWQAGRRAGLTAVVVAIVVSELLLGPSLVLPWNPWPPVLGSIALLVLAWRLLLGHARVLPWFAAVCSLVLQSNLALVANLFPLLVVLAGVGLVRWRQVRGTVWPLPGWRPDHQPPVWRRPGIVAIVLTLLCWAPSIAELFLVHPNNAAQMWAIACVELRGPLHIIGAIVLLVACGWVARIIAIRKELSRRDSVRWVSRLVAAGIALSVVASSGGRLIYLAMMLGGIIFAIAVWVRWEPLARRLRLLPPAAGALGAVLIAFVIGPGGPAALGFTSAQIRNADGASAATNDVTAALRAHDVRTGPVVLQTEGFFSGASYVSAAMVTLTAAGYTPYFDFPWPRPQGDDFRRTEHAPADAVHVTIRDDKSPVVKVPTKPGA